jgi:peptidoglycan/LPS O-acetylase OafA/YrhL
MNIRKFRPDIEVLRAFAVTIVVIAHSKLALHSGFIGVDVFFVISGFLITRHIFEEIQKTGTLSLKNFYAKRILRILPLSTLVLVMTMVLSFNFLSPLQITNFAWDAFFSGFSAINFRFAITGTDYFQAGTAISPFQHFWSLAVEEQFYLVWPLILLFIVKIVLGKNSIPSSGVTKSNIDRFRITINIVLTVIILISLYLSYTITNSSQPWAYFGIHTRAWQLAIGSIISFNLDKLSLIPTRIARVGSWLGFLGLLLGLLVIDEKSPYPGLLALIPTLSTALVIVSGTNYNTKSFETFFDNKYIRWVGKISYSWYLIHWPFFVVMFYNIGERIRPIDKLSMIIITFFLSCLSYLVFENKIRFSPYFKSSFQKTYILGLSLIVVSSMIGYGFANKRSKLDSVFANTIIAQAVEGSIYQKIDDAANLKALPKKLITSLDKAAEDRPTLGCIAEKTDELVKKDPKCITGNKNSDKKIVLLGDSHAHQWVESIDKIAQKYDYRLLSFTKPGCPIEDIKHIDPILKREYTECYSWREDALKQITEMKPEIIISAGIGYATSTEQKFDEYIKKLKTISKNVIRIIDNPKPNEEVFIPECLTKNRIEIQICSFQSPNKNDKFDIPNLEIKVGTANGITLINSIEWLCSNEVCPPIIDNIVVYKDNNHISNTYAKYLSPLLGNKIFRTEDELNQKISEALTLKKPEPTFAKKLNNATNDYPNKKCFLEAADRFKVNNDGCKFGNPSSKKTMVLIGDSHAYQWLSVVDLIAQKYDYKLLVFAKSSCSLADIPLYSNVLNREYTECSEFGKAALSELDNINPDIIITSSLEYENMNTQKYKEFLQKLQTYSQKVIRFGNTPFPQSKTANILDCLVNNQSNVNKCNQSKSDSIVNPSIRSLEEQVAKELGVFSFDPTNLFCSDTTCPAIIDDNLVYMDNSHISKSYSLYIKDFVEKKISPSLN